MRLKDKVAVITGGGLGIGRATAVRLAEEGAKVLVAARREEHLKETVRIIKEAGGEAAYAVTDITDEKAVQDMFKKAAAEFGGVDILFNCAAVFTGMEKRIEDVTLDEWNEAMDVNVTGYFLCTKYVIPYMRKRAADR
jgi:NAD(P)-dependent dehydrogenase (short-subunit alcohol dehydrogenase family)